MSLSSKLAFFWEHLQAQLFDSPGEPQGDFSHQTVIVTGSNGGIGLETARWLVRLGAAKVILAVRDVSKGESAADDIRTSTGCDASVVEVWPLDLTSSGSVEAFAERARRGLERLDVVVANAGEYLYDFTVAEDNETTVTVNVVHTFMLAFLLVPVLRRTSVSFGKETVITFTGSFVHWLTAFPERRSRHIILDLADRKAARMTDRYNVSKLIHLLLTREFAKALDASPQPGTVTTSHTNPGHVKTGILRHTPLLFQAILVPWQKLTARTAEQGGRIMAHAAQGGRDTHGQYLSECRVATPSPFVSSDEGLVVQRQLWEEVGAILEKKHPGIMALI